MLKLKELISTQKADDALSDLKSHSTQGKEPGSRVYKFPNGYISARVEKYNNELWLWWQEVEKKYQGKGLGSAFISLLKDIADKHNVKVRLTPKRYQSHGISSDALEQWYTRQGFKMMPGKDRWMIRKPNTH